ncbi:MAG: DUF6010 family protein [Chitinophagaceae bacterium]
MISVVIGISSGLLVIVIIALLKRLHKETIYGLILSGIGFLYVGFTWSDRTAFIITGVQAVFFLFIAGYGIKRGLYVLAAGYFLHGIWDLVYDLLPASDLIPPHYDLFCLSIDFTIGFYLLLSKYRTKSSILTKT